MLDSGDRSQRFSGNTVSGVAANEPPWKIARDYRERGPKIQMIAPLIRAPWPSILLLLNAFFATLLLLGTKQPHSGQGRTEKTPNRRSSPKLVRHLMSERIPTPANRASSRIVRNRFDNPVGSLIVVHRYFYRCSDGWRTIESTHSGNIGPARIDPNIVSRKGRGAIGRAAAGLPVGPASTPWEADRRSSILRD